MRNQLRRKMKAIRAYYGLSAVAMSRVCGFGDNSWRLYENGQARPVRANEQLIRATFRPSSMKVLLLLADPKEINQWEQACSKANTAQREINRRVEIVREKLEFEFIDTLSDGQT